MPCEWARSAGRTGDVPMRARSPRAARQVMTGLLEQAVDIQSTRDKMNDDKSNSGRCVPPRSHRPWSQLSVFAVLRTFRALIRTIVRRGGQSTHLVGTRYRWGVCLAASCDHTSPYQEHTGAA